MDTKFEDGILGLVPEAEWLDVGFNVTRPSDPIDGLFDDEFSENIMARWQTIASEYQTPVMAHYHGFDTESNTTFRIPVDTHNIEKGLIKVKLNQSERLRELMNSGVQKDALYDYVLADGVRLADQVVTRTKVAKNELLATGKVTIKENNLDLTVDYGVPDKHLNIKFPINDNTDVLALFQKIVDTATLAGVTLTGMVTSRQVISKLRTNKSVQTAINGNLGQGAMVRRDSLYNFLSDEYGLNNIITNDLTYGASAKIDPATDRPVITQQRYFPADEIAFFGTANNMAKMGSGLWGLPPEVSILDSNATASADNRYVYVSQWPEKDPAVVWTKASALFMPVLYDPNSLFTAKVTDK